MRTRLGLVATASAALLLAACTSGDDPGGPDGEPSQTAPDTGSGGDEGDLTEVEGVVVDADSAALSPDGSRVVVPCDGRLCVWTTSDGALDTDWDGGATVAWSPDGEVVATDEVDGEAVSLVLVDAASGEERTSVPAGTTEVADDAPGSGLRDLAWSAEGDALAGVGADGTVRVWAVDDGELADPVEVAEGAGGGGDAVAVAFAPDGSRLAVAASDGPVALLDPSTGELLGSLDAPAQGDVAWSADGSSLATASFVLDLDAATTVWDADTLEVEASIPTAGDEVAFVPGAETLVVSGKDEPGVLVWAWRRERVRILAGATDVPRAVLVSPDGDRAYAVSPRDGVLAWSLDGDEDPVAFETPEEA